MPLLKSLSRKTCMVTCMEAEKSYVFHSTRRIHHTVDVSELDNTLDFLLSNNNDIDVMSDKKLGSHFQEMLKANKKKPNTGVKKLSSNIMARFPTGTRETLVVRCPCRGLSGNAPRCTYPVNFMDMVDFIMKRDEEKGKYWRGRVINKYYEILQTRYNRAFYCKYNKKCPHHTTPLLFEHEEKDRIETAVRCPGQMKCRCKSDCDQLIYCRETYCQKCLEGPYHTGRKCHETQPLEALAKIFPLNSDTEFLFTKTTICPRCHNSVVKSTGCDHMTCNVCKCVFCFVCGLDIFKEFGQGKYGNHGYTCPLVKCQNKTSQEYKDVMARERRKLFEKIYGKESVDNYFDSKKIRTIKYKLIFLRITNWLNPLVIKRLEPRRKLRHVRENYIRSFVRERVGIYRAKKALVIDTVANWAIGRMRQMRELKRIKKDMIKKNVAKYIRKRLPQLRKEKKIKNTLARFTLKRFIDNWTNAKRFEKDNKINLVYAFLYEYKRNWIIRKNKEVERTTSNRKEYLSNKIGPLTEAEMVELFD